MPLQTNESLELCCNCPQRER